MIDALSIANHYFDLSNDGNLSEIKKLFTASSTYSSDSAGIFLGAEQIMEMQQAFFNQYESLNWKVNSRSEVKTGIVLFDFTFSGTPYEGQNLVRHGFEYIVVYEGRIQHIDVRSKS